jgi:hypothetical protein
MSITGSSFDEDEVLRLLERALRLLSDKAESEPVDWDLVYVAEGERFRVAREPHHTSYDGFLTRCEDWLVVGDVVRATYTGSPDRDGDMIVTQVFNGSSHTVRYSDLEKI